MSDGSSVPPPTRKKYKSLWKNASFLCKPQKRAKRAKKNRFHGLKSLNPLSPKLAQMRAPIQENLCPGANIYLKIAHLDKSIY